LDVPYGETRSYHDLATAIGAPSAVRAVGRANGMNRIGILIPCHRIVEKNGDLGGYGGGLRRKQYLLNLEQAALTSPLTYPSRGPFLSRHHDRITRPGCGGLLA